MQRHSSSIMQNQRVVVVGGTSGMGRAVIREVTGGEQLVNAFKEIT